MRESPETHLIEHFFRHEYGKLVSVLSGVFGLNCLDQIEDMVQAALLEALQSWRIHGVPDEPARWVYRVAKNRMLDQLRHRDVARRAQPTIEARQRWIEREQVRRQESVDDLFIDSHLDDSQLAMMFACCHPTLSLEDAIALTLRSLCGFSNSEIARAFLLSEAAIRKRIYRAKQRLIQSDVQLEVPSLSEMNDRLPVVHQVLYLLFNEGYCSGADENTIRHDLCSEACRLCNLLCNHSACGAESTMALMALMLFHAARLDGRLDANGSLLLLEDQDRSRWDQDLITKANEFLRKSKSESQITRFHLEAAIAMLHSTSSDFASTPWTIILQMYDTLLRIHPSPVYSLNRAIVLSQIEGPRAGIDALQAVRNHPQMQAYYLVDATLGQFYAQIGATEEAISHWERAKRIGASRAERELLDRKLGRIRSQPNAFRLTSDES